MIHSDTQALELLHNIALAFKVASTYEKQLEAIEKEQGLINHSYYNLEIKKVIRHWKTGRFLKAKDRHYTLAISPMEYFEVAYLLGYEHSKDKEITTPYGNSLKRVYLQFQSLAATELVATLIYQLETIKQFQTYGRQKDISYTDEEGRSYHDSYKLGYKPYRDDKLERLDNEIRQSVSYFLDKASQEANEKAKYKSSFDDLNLYKQDQTV